MNQSYSSQVETLWAVKLFFQVFNITAYSELELKTTTIY